LTFVRSRRQFEHVSHDRKRQPVTLAEAQKRGDAQLRANGASRAFNSETAITVRRLDKKSPDEIAVLLGATRQPIAALRLGTTVSPKRRSARQRIALDALTPNRAAASRRDDPSSMAERTRERRSKERDLGIKAGLLRQASF